MTSLAVYVTGHGYGHAVRAATVMKALRRRDPSLHFHIRSLAPPVLFERELTRPFDIAAVQLDTGGVERNILFSDPEATIAKARAFYSGIEVVIAREAEFLKQARADGVLSDVPPAASEIAARAGVPSVAVANFTWDRIYEECPDSGELVALIRRYHAKTTLGLEVPLGHEATVFPNRKRIPIIARRSDADRNQVRRELAIKDGDVAVLVALKGEELTGQTASLPRGMRFFGFADFQMDGYTRLGDAWQARFPDVLLACDVVLSKPGYGIVGECIAHRRPLLHLPRMGFAETPHLLRDMDAMMAHRAIGLEDLEPEPLKIAIEELLARPFDWPDKRVDGAEVAAEEILRVIGS